MAVDSFLITCEHGGNRVPAPYRRLFRGRRALLDSHRGYDPGALVMARALAAAFTAPLVTSTVSRLLIDLNRSTGHPQTLLGGDARRCRRSCARQSSNGITGPIARRSSASSGNRCRAAGA